MWRLQWDRRRYRMLASGLLAWHEPQRRIETLLRQANPLHAAVSWDTTRGCLAVELCLLRCLAIMLASSGLLAWHEPQRRIETLLRQANPLHAAVSWDTTRGCLAVELCLLRCLAIPTVRSTRMLTGTKWPAAAAIAKTSSRNDYDSFELMFVWPA